MSKSKAGGGIRSRNVTERPVKTGKGATKYNVKGVSQVGQSLGDHITNRRQHVNPVEKVRDGALGAMGNVPLGNARAAELSGANCGVGKGRTVMRSGSQQGLAPARPVPAGRNTLAEFGRESPIVNSRK
jgi:hypothetical protein